MHKHVIVILVTGEGCVAIGWIADGWVTFQEPCGLLRNFVVVNELGSVY